MESLTRSLNYELSAAPSDGAISSFSHNIPLNKYAQQILENSKNIFSSAASNSSADASTPTITTLDAKSSKSILQTISDTILSSIQNKSNYHKTVELVSHSNTSKYFNLTNMEYTPNQVALDSSSFDAIGELQKQLEYDKFMNEVWIGIVLTLILISLVFCICSCFLYHQFKTWKQNYHTTPHEHTLDIEAVKMATELDDPVPEYTLVSGLPSYEAALELMQKTPKTAACLIVYPSVFSVFNKINEKTTTTPTETITANAAAAAAALPEMLSTAATAASAEVTTPLLTTNTATNAVLATVTATTPPTPTQEHFKTFWSLPSYGESFHYNTCNEKSPKKPRTNKAIMSPSTAAATTTTHEQLIANTTTTTMQHNHSHSHKISEEHNLTNKTEKC